MASHNHNPPLKSKSNVVSLNKTYSVSRKRNHKGKSNQATSSTTGTIDNIRDDLDASNHATKPTFQQPNQNFSSRNSLRTAQSFAAPRPQAFPFSMPVMADYYLNSPPARGIENNNKYKRLTSDCFYRDIGGSQICMLCRKKHKKGDAQPDIHNQLYNELQCALFDQPPCLNSIQMRAVHELLHKWYNDNVLSDSSIEQRLNIVQEFNVILALINPECSTRLTGSLISSTSLVISNINLELIHPNSNLFGTDVRAKNSIHHALIDPDAALGQQVNNHTIHYDLISNPMETLFRLWIAISKDNLKSPTNLFKVTSKLNDLYANIPKLSLVHIESGIELEVCCNLQSSHKLSVLLGTYLALDSRASVLSVLVKVWAKLCKIDNPDQGTLPPHAFVILVIYFLQRTSPPVLPCLHDILNKQSNSSRAEDDVTQKNTMQNGSSKSHNNSGRKSNMTTQMKQEGQNSIQENCVEDPDEIDDEEEEEDDLYIDEKDENIKNLSWSSFNTSPVHELFIEFLKFMMHELDYTQKPITIRSLKKSSNRRWNSQIKVIENPVKPSVNLSRCIGSNQIYRFILQCFRRSFYYLTAIPMDSNLKPVDKHKGEARGYVRLYFNNTKLDSFLAEKEQSSQRKTNIVDDLIRENGLFARDVEVINALFDSLPITNSPHDFGILPNLVAKHYSEDLLRPKDIEVITFCWLCKSSGHLKSECPKGKIEKLQLDYILYTSELDCLDKANLDTHFLNNYQNFKITNEDSFIHRKIVEDLTRMINSLTGLNCHLELYGSTVNNLGSFNSDLDICMTLVGNPTGKGLDFVEILNLVHNKVLMTKSNIFAVEPILSARVPIIKFKYLRNRHQSGERREYDIDLSMYNQCATYNSRLLRMYTLIDERLPQLFFLVKRYAKACQIADASRGTLSSYAWSIMVIHYLQHINPPILPVLQETRDETRKQLIGINGWNVWFNDDLRTITPRTRNFSTLTQLFKGFFIYYGTFDFDLNIVSIRKSFIISRFQKNWNNCLMAIEDPFELTYNLASRLDDQMAIYIMNSFAQAYKHIVEVQNSYCLLGKHTNVLRDIFDGYAITHSTRPPFRGCRVCHRIGHRVKDCPEARHNNIRQPRQNGNNS